MQQDRRERREPYQRKEIELRDPKFVSLKDVKPGRHGSNVFVKVVEVSHSQIEKRDGTKLDIAEGLCGDDTATIKFRVVGDFAKVLQKDSVVAFRNSRSDVVQEFQRLSVDIFGKITAETTKIDKIDQQNNLSVIQYERKGGSGRYDEGDRRGGRGGRGQRRGGGGYRNERSSDRRNNDRSGDRRDYQGSRNENRRRDDRN